MAFKALPSQEVLRQLLRYEPEAGKLFWLPRAPSLFPNGRNCGPWNSRNSGKEALNSLDGKGYLHGTLLGKTVQAHRIVWAIVYDGCPTMQIDHRDGNRSNNRIENLRLADQFINSQNMQIGRRNTSSVVGVTWHKGGKKWAAQIVANGKSIYLGLFSDFDAAVAARRSAEIEHGFHQNRRSA